MALLSTNAGLKWTPPGGTETTHNLQYPLLLESRARVKTRSWTSFPRDFSTRAAFAIDGEAFEYTVLLRFDTSPSELLDLLEDGADGVQVDYYPNLNNSSIVFNCWIVNAGERMEIQAEDARAQKEYQVELTLRTKSGNFGSILGGTHAQ